MAEVDGDGRTSPRTRNAPLSGVRVLDFSIVMAGPMCTRSLADAGAEVIKVESPEGDLRIRPPFQEGMSTYFGSMNCGKQSIVLDLRNDDARAVATQLAAAADVLVENFRPGVMQRFGLDYETLAALNPRLVYCSISGYGQDGPSARTAAYAPVIHAASGFELAHAGYQESSDKPASSGVFHADVLGSIHATAAIYLALFDRERTGLGQHIDVALMDSMLAMLVPEVLDAQFPGQRPSRAYRPMAASDGFIMIAVLTPRNLEALFAVTGFPEGHHSLESLMVPGSAWDMKVIDDHVEQWTRTRSVADCEEALSEAGIPHSRYRTLEEALADPQSVHRGVLATVGRDRGGFQVVNPPYRMSRAVVQAREPVPDLGADAEHVLRKVLGYSPDEVEALRRSGALGRAAQSPQTTR
jgi:CoA:oxalate CoA-transferase